MVFVQLEVVTSGDQFLVLKIRMMYRVVLLIARMVQYFGGFPRRPRHNDGVYDSDNEYAPSPTKRNVRSLTHSLGGPTES